MVIPVPTNLYQISLQPPLNMRKQLQKQEQFQVTHERLTFAHSDWAGYSVFEEAFTLGHWAA